MVIATSDSCNTLVSLNHNDTNNKHSSGLKTFAFCENGGDPRHGVENEPTYERTHLYLPTDDLYQDEDEDDESWFDADEYWHDGPPNTKSTTPTRVFQAQNLYVPTQTSSRSAIPIDEHLRTIPEVMESADILLANPPRQFNKQSTERVLYVSQGEVAHAVSSQCDVVASDKATTCHILALRSTSKTSPNQPLVSLTHLDSDEYESSIRSMVQQHKAHHSNLTPSLIVQQEENNCGGYQEEKKQDDDSFVSAQDASCFMEMDIHIMGGFNDEDGSSRQISESTMALLVQVAKEESHCMKMTLQTCAITSMNDTGYQCPIGRGLGINIQTGETFLCQVSSDVTGPQSTLRSVRLWSSEDNHSPDTQKTLTTIHTSYSNEMVITPFVFKPFKEIDTLLRLPDEIMIRYTSTSPAVEEDDFCDNVRQTMMFMRSKSYRSIFSGNGTTTMEPLTYRRKIDTTTGRWMNEWVRT
mmetsp:Transcript_28491/g.40033  ORF Transcript_28491/g.40033 Transcript_28491/m.40033 type:complete len:469 (-) Transcript_28491:198-1604(-)